MSISSSVEQQDITSTSGLPTTKLEAEFAAQDGNATTKVLATDELLLLVLESVPVHDRLPLLRVSKKWNSIASSIGYVVGPIAGLELDDEKPSLFKSGAPGPRYVIESTMRVNPAINSSAASVSFLDSITFMMDGLKYAHQRLPLVGVTVVLESVDDSTKLLSERNEFITSPPITMIMVGSRFPISDVSLDEYHAVTAILREDTGIRIGHLLDTFEKMRASPLQVHQQDPRWPEATANSIMRQQEAFFHYSSQAVLTYSEGAETQFERQYIGLPGWMRGSEKGSEDGTQDSNEDDEEDDEGDYDDNDDDDDDSGEGSEENNEDGHEDDDDDSHIMSRVFEKLGLVQAQSEDESEDDNGDNSLGTYNNDKDDGSNAVMADSF